MNFTPEESKKLAAGAKAMGVIAVSYKDPNTTKIGKFFAKFLKFWQVFDFVQACLDPF